MKCNTVDNHPKQGEQQTSNSKDMALNFADEKILTHKLVI
jgi:hypothetical protein